MASEGKNLVGVDIGSSSIKVVEIEERKNQRTLVRFGFHPLPAQTVVDAQAAGTRVMFSADARLSVAMSL